MEIVKNKFKFNLMNKGIKKYQKWDLHYRVF